MILRWLKSESIKARLTHVSTLSLLTLIIIASGLYMVLLQVRENVDLIVEDRFSQVMENSHNSRTFGLLHARLNVFRAAFYGQNQFVESEGASLKLLLEQLSGDINDPQLKELLRQLQDEFSIYLVRVRWVNSLIEWRRNQEEEITELVRFTQQTLASREPNIVERGSLEHLIASRERLRNIHERLSAINQMTHQEDQSSLFTSTTSELPPPLVAAFRDLFALVEPLANEEYPFNLLGRELVTRLQYLSHLISQYRIVMSRLAERERFQDALSDQILLTMEEFDRRNQMAVQVARTDVGNVLAATFVTVLGVLVSFVSLILLGHWFLFRKYIQVPIARIAERMTAFHDGDYLTPLQLKRRDEWNEIEIGFNQMLQSLEQSLIDLRESEQRYREIFTNSTEGIFRSTPEGRFVALNPAAVAMLGQRSEAEAIAYYSDLNSQLYCDPQARVQLLKGLEKTGRNTGFETQVLRKDGNSFWASINNHLVHDADGHVRYIEGTVQDISARRVAQDALHQLKSYLQGIIDSMPSILIGVDGNFNVTLWNVRAEVKTGISAKQVVGAPLSRISTVFNLDKYLPALEEAVKQQKPLRLQKTASPFHEEENAERFYDLLAYPLDGVEAEGTVIHLDDVTEQVRMGEMMVQAEKMESIDGLAAGLAHEINNPLAIILQNVQVVERRLSLNLSKNCETATALGTTMQAITGYMHERGCDMMLRSIAAAGTRAAKIVENLQIFSRRSISDFAPQQLSDMVEGALELAVSDYDMRHTLNFTGVNIVRDFHPAPKILCDAGQIQQTLLILLKNAAQALTETQAQQEIRLSIVARDNQVCLQVEDNGAGMSDDVCRRVFDPFYTTREVGSGTGLGLSTAYYIITRNHRGQMSVRSKPGGGTSFEICLPVFIKGHYSA